jgi:hypothetical protein
MAQLTRAQLEALWIKDFEPTESNYDDVWESFLNLLDDDNIITNAKLAQVAEGIIKGRISSGTGNVEDLTADQVTAMLNQFTDALKGLVPASGGGTINFLRADGTFAAPPGGGYKTIAYQTAIIFDEAIVAVQKHIQDDDIVLTLDETDALQGATTMYIIEGDFIHDLTFPSGCNPVGAEDTFDNSKLNIIYFNYIESGNVIYKIIKQDIDTGFIEGYGIMTLDTEDAGNFVFASGNEIEDWLDQSANDSDANTPTDPDFPLLLSGVLNGKDIVNFGGDPRQAIENLRNFHSHNGMTFIIAMKDAGDGNDAIFSNFDTGSGDSGAIFDFQKGWEIRTNGARLSNAYVQNSAQNVTYSLSTSNYQLIIIRWVPGQELIVYIDGISQGTASEPSKGMLPANVPAYVSGRYAGAWVDLITANLASVKLMERALSLGELLDYAKNIGIIRYGIAQTLTAFVEGTPTLGNLWGGKLKDNSIMFHITGEVLDLDSIPDTTDFTLTGTSASVSSVEVGINWVNLVLDQDLDPSDTPVLSYAAGTNPIQSPKENQLANFSSQSVTNLVMDISSSSLVLDSREPSDVILSGDLVTAWNDKTSNNIDFSRVSDTNNQGRYIDYNFYKKIVTSRKDAVSHFIHLSAGTSAVPYSTVNGMTCIVVVRFQVITATQYIISRWYQFGGGEREFRLTNGIWGVVEDTASYSSAKECSYTPTQNKLHILVGRWDPGTLTDIIVDGVKQTPAVTPATTINTGTSAELVIGSEQINLQNQMKADLEYIEMIPTFLSDAAIKPIIEALRDIFEVEDVDVSGL